MPGARHNRRWPSGNRARALADSRFARKHSLDTPPQGAVRWVTVPISNGPFEAYGRYLELPPGRAHRFLAGRSVPRHSQEVTRWLVRSQIARAAAFVTDR